MNAQTTTNRLTAKGTIVEALQSVSSIISIVHIKRCETLLQNDTYKLPAVLKYTRLSALSILSWFHHRYSETVFNDLFHLYFCQIIKILLRGTYDKCHLQLIGSVHCGLRRHI